MSIILTDIASVLSLSEFSRSYTKIRNNISIDVAQMIQNIILCDSIIIDKELAENWNVLSTYNLYEAFLILLNHLH